MRIFRAAQAGRTGRAFEDLTEARNGRDARYDEGNPPTRSGRACATPRPRSRRSGGPTAPRSPRPPTRGPASTRATSPRSELRLRIRARQCPARIRSTPAPEPTPDPRRQLSTEDARGHLREADPSCAEKHSRSIPARSAEPCTPATLTAATSRVARARAVLARTAGKFLPGGAGSLGRRC